MKYIFIFLAISSLNFSLTAQDIELEWAIGQGGIEDDSGISINIDVFNNIIVVGTFKDTVDFDPGPDSTIFASAGGYDGFIQKLDVNGSLLWVKQIGNTSAEYIWKTTTDESANILSVGIFFSDTVDFNPGSGIANLISANGTCFIQKLDTDGNFLWAQNFNISNMDNIMTDINSNIYLSGSFYGTVDFDSGPSQASLTSEGSDDGFILKLDTDGNFLWVKQISGSSLDVVWSSDLDANGNIISIGDFYETTDFDPGVEEFDLTTNGYVDCFIQKLDSDGNFLWAHNIGGPLSTHGKFVSIDLNGNILITGIFNGTVDFDPGSDVSTLSTPNTATFILKLNSLGEFLWAYQMGNSASNDVITSIATDYEGNLYSTGTFAATVDFNPGVGIAEMTSNGLKDVFIQKLNSEGNFIWVQQMGGIKNDRGNSIWIAENNSIYTTGNFRNSVDFDPENGITNIVATGDTLTTNDIFIQKLWQDSCSNFGISIDSFSNISCDEPSQVSCHAFGGPQPYSYNWDTNPPILDSIVNIESSGIYTVEATNSLGCIRTLTLLIEGPEYNGFDMDANLVSETFSPGFNGTIIIDAYNDGCILTEGSITLVLDSLVDFNYADVDPDVDLGDTLIWDFDEISSDTDNFILNIETLTSTDAAIGDTVCFELFISPINGDVDSTNNTKHYCFPVVNGYDPNDKKVYPQGICENHFVLKTDDLTYTIRFQNTGNAEAINIHIIDTLSTYLDINTVEILGSSHDMYTLIRPGNVVDFMFDDIYLPNSTSNEPESHGYVIFKIYPNSFIYNGTYVDNKSEIYFDYNPPIVTNTVFNTLVNELLSCDINMGVDEDHTLVNDVLIYPNPSNGLITVDFGSLKEVDLKMFNLSGQLIYSKENVSRPTHQFVLNEPAGIYILEISASKGRQYYKVVIE